MSMQKTAGRWQPSKNAKALLVTVSIVGLGLLVWFFINAIQIAQDRARFAEVSKEKSQIASRLVDYLGSNVVSTREQDECFNTEQGPFDNGRLWCQVASVVQLNRDVEYSDIGKEYLLIGRSLGLSQTSVSTFSPDFSLSLNGSRCDLELQSSSGSTMGNPARSLFSSLTKVNPYPAFTVACADRARASFYPYHN